MPSSSSPPGPGNLPKEGLSLPRAFGNIRPLNRAPTRAWIMRNYPEPQSEKSPRKSRAIPRGLPLLFQPKPVPNSSPGFRAGPFRPATARRAGRVGGKALCLSPPWMNSLTGRSRTPCPSASGGAEEGRGIGAREALQPSVAGSQDRGNGTEGVRRFARASGIATALQAFGSVGAVPLSPSGGPRMAREGRTRRWRGLPRPSLPGILNRLTERTFFESRMTFPR
jgi:hypothetical protein